MGAKRRLKRVAIHIAGWSFILLGVAGLFLPILQGILFILVGLFLLSSVSPWAARLLDRIKKRFPRISNQFDHAKSKSRSVQTSMAAKLHGVKEKARRAHSHVFKRKPKTSED
jgi:uncharacterized membrane protein YbaN (DUF454 family)